MAAIAENIHETTQYVDRYEIATATPTILCGLRSIMELILILCDNNREIIAFEVS
jgi:hypothetical protein